MITGKSGFNVYDVLLLVGIHSRTGEVLAGLLARGKASRLNRALRLDRQLAQEVEAKIRAEAGGMGGAPQMATAEEE